MVFYMVMPTDCDYVPINIDEFRQLAARIKALIQTKTIRICPCWQHEMNCVGITRLRCRQRDTFSYL